MYKGDGKNNETPQMRSWGEEGGGSYDAPIIYEFLTIIWVLAV